MPSTNLNLEIIYDIDVAEVVGAISLDCPAQSCNFSYYNSSGLELQDFYVSKNSTYSIDGSFVYFKDINNNDDGYMVVRSVGMYDFYSFSDILPSNPIIEDSTFTVNCGECKYLSMSFESNVDSATFYVNNVSNKPNLEYRIKNNGEYSRWFEDIESKNWIINLNKGDDIQLRGLNTNGFSKQNYTYSSFYINQNFSVYGNIMSLVDYDNPSTQIPGYSYCFYKLFTPWTREQTPTLSSISSNLLPALNLKPACYHSLFLDCRNLTLPQTFNLPATNLENSCYAHMLENCASLKLSESFTLPATVAKERCYAGMFHTCTSLRKLPNNFSLPSLVAPSDCYWGMFYGSGLESLPENFILPATSLGYRCYGCMFFGCGNLKSLPNTNLLPATSTAQSCYEDMFYYCSSLEQIPNNFSLPAQYVGIDAYKNMFGSCTKLQILPDNFTLPGIYLNSRCYQDMFSSCKSLTKLPTGFNLPAGSIDPASGIKKGYLGAQCYKGMFSGCMNLTLNEDFSLLATDLTSECYEKMFNYCSSIVLPAGFVLPVENLADGCYKSMFSSCAKIHEVRLYARALGSISLTDFLSNAGTDTSGGASAGGVVHCVSGMESQIQQYLPSNPSWTAVGDLTDGGQSLTNGASLGNNARGNDVAGLPPEQLNAPSPKRS